MGHPRNKADRKRIEGLKAKRRSDFIRARFNLDTDCDSLRSKLLGYTQLLDRRRDYYQPLDRSLSLKDQDY